MINQAEQAQPEEENKDVSDIEVLSYLHTLLHPGQYEESNEFDEDDPVHDVDHETTAGTEWNIISDILKEYDVRSELAKKMPEGSEAPRSFGEWKRSFEYNLLMHEVVAAIRNRHSKEGLYKRIKEAREDVEAHDGDFILDPKDYGGDDPRVTDYLRDKDERENPDVADQIQKEFDADPDKKKI